MAERRPLTYFARIGGTRELPIICGHEHALVEEAAACVPSHGEVYEEADEVIQDTFWIVRKGASSHGTAGSIERQAGCAFVGKSRSEISPP
jgi:hypothetical protein